ncbi:MAG: hypothetical protein V1936_02690 [Patescibacteria group bacterium]
MIDTVVLTLPPNKFSIVDYSYFAPNCRGLFHEPYTDFRGLPFIKCVQNPTKQDAKESNYKPRLTVIKRVSRNGFLVSLKIEFSVPKLLFGNNFEEITEKDFPKILKVLRSKLMQMRVMTSEENLRNAKVSVIHFSKNIAFTDFTTVSSILNKIRKANFTRQLDLNSTKFRNEGAAVYFYAKSHSFVLYDKIEDLKQPKSRSVEQDKDFNLQLNIFDEIRRKEMKPLEVLRLEFRVCDTRKLKALLKEIGEDWGGETFEELFSEKISKKMLLNFWEKIWHSLKTILLTEISPVQIFERIIKSKKITPQAALALFSFSQILNLEGARQMRRVFEKRFSDRTFSRFLKKFEEIEFPALEIWEPFRKIEQDVQDFYPFRMKNFQNYDLEGLLKKV